MNLELKEEQRDRVAMEAQVAILAGKISTMVNMANLVSNVNKDIHKVKTINTNDIVKHLLNIIRIM